MVFCVSKQLFFWPCLLPNYRSASRSCAHWAGAQAHLGKAKPYFALCMDWALLQLARKGRLRAFCALLAFCGAALGSFSANLANCAMASLASAKAAYYCG
jgi:hypothetical protein